MNTSDMIKELCNKQNKVFPSLPEESAKRLKTSAKSLSGIL